MADDTLGEQCKAVCAGIPCNPHQAYPGTLQDDPQELGIYIHWPFCRALCPYCHFNRYQGNADDWGLWTQAFCRAIETWGRTLRHVPYRVVSLFFGGGTPSLMRPSLVARIVQAIQEHFACATPLEITLEMTPTDVSGLSSFADAGINRISMGIQSFDAQALALLGRKHTLQDIHEALVALKDSGLRTSFDLIYGHRLHDDPQVWQAELEAAARLLNGHISLYQLSYEKGTPFYRHRHQTLTDEQLLDLESRTSAMLEPLGMVRYEVSNYAHPGQESIHNLVYWRYQDFLGIGPGAHGRLAGPGGRKWVLQDEALPDVWLSRVEASGHGLVRNHLLNNHDQIKEHVLMGLRLQEGMDVGRLVRTPFLLHSTFFDRMRHCQDAGLCRWDDAAQRMILTPSGRCVLDSIVSFVCRSPLLESDSPCLF